MATLEFTKMHGCGNDYIYVVALKARPADPAALAVRVSDRHFGIGGDGLIMLAPSRTADVRMEMYNADGSRGDMCGNGIRCVARLAYERGIARKSPMVIETDSGLKTIELRFEAGAVAGATVDMGEPILDGREIPVTADGRIIDYALEV
ncbi:MAG: diaminopimelate epimerase, partial [Candidatus Binataceae bacterium]